MKKWLFPLMVLFYLGFTVVSPVEAGDKSRHRWQGIAIGAASFLLLDHFIDHSPATGSYGYYTPQPRYYGPGYGYGYDPGCGDRYSFRFYYEDGPRYRDRHDRGYGPYDRYGGGYRGGHDGRYDRGWDRGRGHKRGHR